VKEAIRLCFAAGFHAQDVAIISWRGREQSELLRHDRLGANALRSFTGQYDLLGQPEYSGGEVLIESVYRFKGQSAPAVILAEIDFETLDERTLRKLFVGATRAMMKLVLVASERAAAQLRDKLAAHP
ncbi:ATP-binding domain-containing protein, partial [Salmonella enterica subsp. enterica serovar Typhimurium]|nr:ATP-binding domain-containing protein [Salmonella enterica subsp. enterica serovar Typhimurium]